MIAYVLTRTANRPHMFANLRAALLAQHFPGRVVHVVHAETGSDYAEGDIVITSRHLPRHLGTAPWELHNQRLLDAVRILEPGWITFMDDDDTYTSEHALATMLQPATGPYVMPIWRVQRAHHRTRRPLLSPRDWAGDLSRPNSALCWEAAAHHTMHIGRAAIDANGGADGRYWLQMSRILEPVWRDITLTRPQVGKGHGRRRDAA